MMNQENHLTLRRENKMRNRIIIIFLLILWFSFSVPVHSAIPAEERAALIALYNSTNGDGWLNKDGWKGNNNEPDGFSKIGSEGNWYGIKVTGNRVKFIDLDNNNLLGTIPEELGNLNYLKRLYLYNNKLTGKIPPELGDLSNLVGLSLVFNQLSGEIPPRLGNLSNLKWLYLYYNQLTGSIPEELGKLTKLEELYLNNNQLSGEIPLRLGNLSYLKRLYLCFNQLTGSIPGDLRKLKDIEELSLNNNQMSEKIPPGLENLSKLRILYLSSNQLTGDIPDKLDTLSNLEELYLHENLLTGDIPPELGDLSNLKKLYLNYNVLDGPIPPELGDLSNLEELCLNDNFLDGTIPPELGNLSNLKILYLSRNQLTGGIPEGLGDLSYLEVLYLNDNQLSYEIPTALGNLLNLRILNLSSNRLTGSIPGELGKLKNLLVLQLNSNQLQLGNTSNLPNITSLKKNLLDELSDFRWNALYTDNKDMKDFLKLKQWGKEWENTQTILPTNITASAKSANSMEVSWSPIAYADDPGGYDVFYRLNKDDPYTMFNGTDTKKESRLEVTGLIPSTTYYFVVQTRTEPHANNKNTILSEISGEVSAKTMDAKKTISGKVTDASGVGVEGVTLTFSKDAIDEIVITQADGTYEHQVPNRWSGTVTPSKGSLCFFPPSIDYPDVTEDQTGQDFQLSITLTLSATWEEDKAALIKTYYGKIKISYIRIDTEGLASIQLNIYRKISGDDNYMAIKSFPKPMANICELTYDDKNLDKNKSYTYIARAIDNNNNTVGESNELTISANK
jgi:Leucine-rich repeat (LRR) protein